MSNQVAPITPEKFADIIFYNGPKDIMTELPDHIRPELFKRNLVVAAQENDKLLECNHYDVFVEVCKAAALGLYFDRHLGEAYLLTTGGWGNKPLKPQMRTGYRGLIKLARQAGSIANLTLDLIGEHDHVINRKGSNAEFSHEINIKDRGKPVAVYSFIEFTNGKFDFEIMTINECFAIRERSEGWQAYKAKRIKSTPWATDPAEMCKKTVCRRMMKRIQQSPELAMAFEMENGEYPDINQARPKRTQQRTRQIEGEYKNKPETKKQPEARQTKPYQGDPESIPQEIMDYEGAIEEAGDLDTVAALTEAFTAQILALPKEMQALAEDIRLKRIRTLQN